MNDEQFDHRIREAARRIADRAAPRSLRLRVAAIPAERPRTGRPKRRLGDLVRVPATGRIVRRCRRRGRDRRGHLVPRQCGRARNNRQSVGARV